jgi:hypothetical protein
MLEDWRGLAGDVALVLRRRWRVITMIMLVAMLLPALPLSGLIADGVAMGTSISPHGKGPLGLLLVAVLLAPVLLALAAGCGQIVTRGWTGALRVAASASTSEPADWRGTLRGARPGTLVAAQRRARLAPMGFVLAVIVGCEVVAALVLSWLLSSASPAATGAGFEGINGPVAVIAASLVALPGSVFLAAASSASYARLTVLTPGQADLA